MSSNHSRVRSKVIGGGTWLLVGNTCVRAVGIASSILVIRMLGMEGTGVQATILAVHAFVGPVASLNAADGVIHYVSAAHPDGRHAQVRIYLGLKSLVTRVSVVVAVVLAVLSPAILDRFFGIGEYWWLLAGSAPAIVLLAVAGVQSAMLNALGEFKASAVLIAVTGIAQAVIVVPAVALAGLKGFCIGYVLSAAITYVVGDVVLKRTQAFAVGLPAARPALGETWKIVLSYCAPSFAASTVVGGFTAYCIGLLSVRPNGTAQVGQYSGANRFASPLAFLTGGFASAALPTLTGSIRATTGARKSSTQVMLTHFALVIAVCVVVGAPLYIFAPTFMSLLGHEFVGHEAVLRVLIGATALQVIAQVALNYLAAHRRMYRTLTVAAVAAVVAAIFAPMLIDSRGAVGLAFSQLVFWGCLLVCAIGASYSMKNAASTAETAK